jgi:hypothetical protein
MVALALLLPAILIAQWQVNRQVYRGGVQSSSPGAVKYSTSLLSNSSVALPSQVRYSAFTSGATPSALKMQYNAVGPLAPSGAMAYIPPAPNYRTSKPVTGNYVNLQQPAPAPLASGFAASPSASMGSVRLAPTPGVSTASPFSGIQSSPASPFGGIQPSSVSSASMLGSVKYTP